LPDGNRIACFFRIERTLAAKRTEFLERFGIVPDFKARLRMARPRWERSA
jgi:hypothetical protein